MLGITASQPVVSRIADYLFPVINDADKQQLVGIQSMRGIAASLVIVDHLIYLLYEAHIISVSWIGVGQNLGTAGVYLFFSISGFVMFLTSGKKFFNIFSTFDFFCRRLIRILPLYALATLIAYSSRVGTESYYAFENLVMSLLFIPYIGAGDDFRPIIGQGWTLNYEIFFYVIFAIALSARKSVGLLFVVVTISFFGMGLNNNLVQSGSIESFYFNSVVLYFLLGVLISVLCKWQPFGKYLTAKNATLAVVLSSSFLILFVVSFSLFVNSVFQTVTGLLFIGMALLVVCSASLRYSNQFLSRMFIGLGNASYSTYLFHGFVVGHSKFMLNSTQLNSTQLVCDNNYFFRLFTPRFVGT